MNEQVKKPVCIELFLLLIRYIYIYILNHVYRNETRRAIFFYITMYEGTRSMNVCSSAFPECLPTNLLPSPLSTSVANCSMLPVSSSFSISGSAVIVPSFKSASGSSSCSPTITCWSFPSAKPCARTSQPDDRYRKILISRDNLDTVNR